MHFWIISVPLSVIFISLFKCVGLFFKEIQIRGALSITSLKRAKALISVYLAGACSACLRSGWVSGGRDK